MNRKYTRNEYLERVAMIHKIIPDCSISTDIIAGFCGESEEDHEQTMSLMKDVEFYTAFMFQYSERPNTKAARHYKDDVPSNVKNRRLNEIIKLQNELSLASNQKDLGKVFEVLVEGASKKSKSELCGRNQQNKICVFPADGHKQREFVKSDNSCTSATLKGEVVK
jgi:tRNA-2-methylthio-N6-dimethylallyladenosine synthase